jgi:hypothetical protein
MAWFNGTPPIFDIAIRSFIASLRGTKRARLRQAYPNWRAQQANMV